MNTQQSGVGGVSRKSQEARPVFATVCLLDQAGQSLRKWLIHDRRSSIGSHPDCSIQIVDAGLEPVHVTLQFGKRHIALKAFADNVLVESRPVSDWLFDTACDVQIGSLRLRVIPQRELSNHSSESASAFLVPPVASPATQDVPPTATNEANLASIHLLIQTLINPLHQGIDELRKELAQSKTPTRGVDWGRVPSDTQAPTRLVDEIDLRIRSILQKQDEHLAATLQEFQTELYDKSTAEVKPALDSQFDSLKTFAQNVEHSFADIRHDLETIRASQPASIDSDLLFARLEALERHQSSLTSTLHDLLVREDQPVPEVTPQTVLVPNTHELSDIRHELSELRNLSQQSTEGVLAEFAKFRTELQTLLAERAEFEASRTNAPDRTSGFDRSGSSNVNDATGHSRLNGFNAEENLGQVASRVTPWFDAVAASPRFEHADEAPVFQEAREIISAADRQIEESIQEDDGPSDYSAQDIYARFKQDFADESEAWAPEHAPQDPYSLDHVDPAELAIGTEEPLSEEEEALWAQNYQSRLAPERIDEESLEEVVESDSLALHDEHDVVPSIDQLPPSNAHPASFDLYDRLRAFREEYTEEPLADASPSEQWEGEDQPASKNEAALSRAFAPESEQDETRDDETEPTFQPASSPALKVTETPHEEEDSIESYMEQLLRRVRGDTSMISGVSTEKAGRKTDTQSTSDRMQAIRTTIDHENAKVPTLIPEGPAEPAVELPPRPRPVPAEKSTDMNAMRELANTTARSAINKSTRRRVMISLYSKIAVSIVGFASAVFLYTINGLQLNFALVGTVASLFVGGLWGWESANDLRKLKAQTKPSA